MKTAMQELIEAINLITKKYKRGLSIEEILDMCNNQLDKEKEQIMNAFSRGLGTELSDWENSEQYYERIYNENK
jgi:uncharacterized membrane-anchored protein YhcB (DUF1043 family)